MNVFTRIHFGKRVENIYSKDKSKTNNLIKLTFEMVTSCQCRTINCNVIWETCWTKLISVCNNGKLCEIRPVDIYYTGTQT